MPEGLRTFTVTLPLPPRELSPNARVHWSARNRAAQQCKLVAMGTAHAVWRGEPMQRAFLCYTFSLCAARGDLDNLASRCKAAIDGIVAAGVLVDDGPRVIDESQSRVVVHPHQRGQRCAGPTVQIDLQEH